MSPAEVSTLIRMGPGSGRSRLGYHRLSTHLVKCLGHSHEVVCTLFVRKTCVCHRLHQSLPTLCVAVPTSQPHIKVHCQAWHSTVLQQITHERRQRAAFFP